MQMKLFYGVVALACVPAVVAATDGPYPKEKLAEFVIEKLDVTTLPPAIRPKREKGKKTFAEYGYVTRQIADKEAVLEVAPRTSQINIRVLEQESAGIFVCVEGQAKDASSRIQRVYLLKLKGGNGLLKGRESWREFDGCPVVGGVDAEAAGY
jgi:hypothetical protein